MANDAKAGDADSSVAAIGQKGGCEADRTQREGEPWGNKGKGSYVMKKRLEEGRKSFGTIVDVVIRRRRASIEKATML